MGLLHQQLAALPPKTFDNLTAISGEIPRFPLTSSDGVVRVIPSAAAASVMVSPNGSIHCRSAKPTGLSDPYGSGRVRDIAALRLIVFSKCQDDYPPPKSSSCTSSNKRIPHLLPSTIQRLRQYARLAPHTKKIGVRDPARQNMHGDVSRHARTRSLPNIHSEIDSV